MSRLISPRGEESVKTKESRVVKVVQFVSYLIDTSLLCVTILALLVSQFGLKTKSFRKVLYNLQKTHRIKPRMLSYPIKERFISPTMQIVFTESKLAEIPICVKVWQRQRIKENVATQIQYLLEGFVYNQHCAPGVYFGIAYLEGLSENAQTFQRGRITVRPRKSKLEHGEYAYVMKVLKADWRLDYRLHAEEETLATTDGMIFLAREVARLHRRAKRSHGKRGVPESIVKKLEFNAMRFDQALQKFLQDGIDVSAYLWIGQLMMNTVANLEKDFERRYNQGHIKRCHGDLKLTNLWIRPASAKFPQQQLLALDCIDFNPDFCHIDTLSDVAMLAMDLQMHLQNGPQSSKCEELVDIFIATYLQEMKEHREGINTLWQYYITEKTMVCAYVSILLDDDTESGRKYLSLAQQHALRLQSLLPLIDEQAVHFEEEEVVGIPGLATIP